MGPQVEGKEVARGILDSIVRGRRVMRGGGVKVPVARIGLKPIQLRHPGPELRLQRRQTAGQTVGALGDQSQSPLTLERLKEVGGRRSLQAIRQQMLEKAPPRGPIFQGAAHPEEQPLVIGKLRVDPCRRGLVELRARRSKETLGKVRVGDDGMGGLRWTMMPENFHLHPTLCVERYCAETLLFTCFATHECSRDPHATHPPSPRTHLASHHFFTEFWTLLFLSQPGPRETRSCQYCFRATRGRGRRRAG